MNRKTMAYALAGISAISFLSFGTPTFAEERVSYEIVCEGTPLATFDTKVLINYLSQDLEDGAILERKNKNIIRNTDAAQREVDKLGNITPKGAKKNKNAGKFYLTHREDGIPNKSIAKHYTAFEDNGLKDYLAQFGEVSVMGEYGAGSYSYSFDTNTVITIQLLDHYLYHPQLKKLYAFSPLSEIQYEDKENSLNTLSDSYQYHAGLIECSLKKDGKNLASSPVETAKVAETPEGETSKVDTPKAETPIVEEEHTPIVENIPVIAPTPVSEHITHLSDMTYETDKKGYHAIKTQPLFVVVKNFGLDFKKDREALAKHFGIEKYVGSYVQNMQIKNELLKLIIVK